jgi:hypothetical protein
MSLAGLNSLLKAISKPQVEKALSLTFSSRCEKGSGCVELLCSILSLESVAEGEVLHEALLECIKVSLASGSVEALAELFQEKGADVDPKLRSLVGKIIEARLPTWKEAAAMNRVSLPRLLDHDWALHMQRASSQVASMNVPAVLVQLRVEDQPTRVNEMPQVSNIDFEISKEGLSVMLDGLGKIKTQLGMMSGK